MHLALPRFLSVSVRTVRMSVALMPAFVILSMVGGSRLTADDSYVHQSGTQWTFGTASAERTVALEDGRFVLKSLKNRVTGHEMIAKFDLSDEFSFADGGEGRISGGSGGWKLVGSKQTTLKHGEKQLDITLQRNSLQVTKSYVIYPGSSLVREWLAFKNAGNTSIKVIEPSMLNVAFQPGEPKSLDFLWMTGGECVPGCWTLKTDKLDAKPAKFDSYEPMPIDPGKVHPTGDGVNAKILLNGKQVWPESGWAFSAHSMSKIPFDFDLNIKQGDNLVFLVSANANIGFDTTALDPSISYADGETHVASQEFSSEQGKSGWKYQYIENGKFVDLVYYPEASQWRKAQDNATHTPFIGAAAVHPDANQDVTRVWTAPKNGRVHISGSICNTGNFAGGGEYGPRPGSGSYAPWYALYDRDSRNGVYIGWDYFGHWRSSFNLDNGDVWGRLIVAGHKQTLNPGESFSTPKAFTGLYTDDLDNAGNEVLNWQYRYMWDYTREGWFPAIRMLGYWWKGTGWMWQQYSGYQDIDSTVRKVFRTADLMRYCGADVYHRDWGWWDKAGDWNGPDWNITREYLEKSGMGQLIYAYVYGPEGGSKVATEHPDWMIGGLLDMSKPEVVQFLKDQLDSFRQRWGRLEWRTDGGFTTPKDGDDTPLLGQDQGFREIIKSFLDHNPDCAFQACNAGGNYASYEYVSFSSCIQMTDGAVGILSNYYTSLLLPPDRTCHMPDSWDPNKYDKSTWRGLLSLCFDMTGDTWDPDKLEGVRTLIDIYHYLEKHGVVGRWVKVYRPVIEGDDPTMYFQRLSGDRKRGIIITKHKAEGPVTIKAKGLIADMTYTVSYQENPSVQHMTGKQLMEQGISFASLPEGELIYLNLPLHPGSKLDTERPTAPVNVTKQTAENIGCPGVELVWKPAKDNNWISYYEILRNGEVIDKVSKGTYYFDHSAGADPASAYEVRTVDGAGNTSEKCTAMGKPAQTCMIVDDASKSIEYSGNWDLHRRLLPAYCGTVTNSNENGASAEYTFEGKEVFVFAKLGNDCGKADISIDGGAADTVDTYSADDIWGVCIYRKQLPAGKHTLRVSVAGSKQDRSKDCFVCLDGIRVQP